MATNREKRNNYNKKMRIAITVLTVLVIAIMAVAVAILMGMKDKSVDTQETTTIGVKENSQSALPTKKTAPTTAEQSTEPTSVEIVTIPDETTAQETITETAIEETDVIETESETGETQASEEQTSSEETAPTESEPVPTEPVPTESVVTEPTVPVEAPTTQIYDAGSAIGISYEDVVFIGDSRTLSMATGGSWAFALVPDDSVCASWGGQLVDESAFVNAQLAGAKKKKAAVFWYGINDIHHNPYRDDPAIFILNYQKVIERFKEYNDDTSTLYFVSILKSTNLERDYYEGQNENIAKYNEALKQFCAQNGYIYLDATGLIQGSGAGCFADAIHFSQSFYQNLFLPFIAQRVEGIYKY